MCTMAAPALAASTADAAICCGVTGTAGFLPGVSADPVTAQEIITLRCMVLPRCQVGVPTLRDRSLGKSSPRVSIIVRRIGHPAAPGKAAPRVPRRRLPLIVRCAKAHVTFCIGTNPNCLCHAGVVGRFAGSPNAFECTELAAVTGHR